MNGLVRIRRRQPDYVVLLALSTLLAVVWWAGVAPPPDSLARTLPPWALIGYYGLQSLGAAVGWVSVFWPRGKSARVVLLAELASRQAIGLACLVAGVAILAYAGLRGVTAAGFLLAWAATSIWRIVHIISDYRTLTGKALPGWRPVERGPAL